MNKFEIGNKIKVSLEAIRPQSGELFNELASICKKLQETPNISNVELAHSGLDTAIKRHTNMSVKFRLVERSDIAAASIDIIDKNHVFYKQIKTFVNEKIDQYQTKDIEDVGSVNLETGKVGGIFTKMPMRIFIGEHYFNNVRDEEYAFTPEEVAAVILHELGHIFVSLEYISKTVITGLFISNSVRNVMDMPAGTNRSKVLKNYVDKTRIELSQDEVDSILSKHGKNSDIVILSESLYKKNGLTKTSRYDARLNEQMADQFSQKHGAGADLVTALAKSAKFHGNSSYSSLPKYVLFQTLDVLFTLGSLIGSFTINPLLSIYLGFQLLNLNKDKIHDDPAERFLKVKQEMISDLRELDKTANKKDVNELREKLLNDIKIIDEQLDLIKSRPNVLQALWDVATPWGRNKAQQEAKQLLLQETIDNELYVKSAQLLNAV